jgi:para-nitrobenzyl esterase
MVFEGTRRRKLSFEEELNRRRFLQDGSACLGIAAQRSHARLFWGSAPDRVEVRTTFGTLLGAKENGVLSFKGVPYAGPVDGEHRFRQAPPLQPWSGTRDALKLGPPSWQPGKTYFGIEEPTPQENCLVLTVWTPAADRKRRPVMFYSHGGGFVVGSSGAPSQDGANLAREYDVVVVSSNHRLGLLGYLYLGEIAGEEYATSGNQGLLDIADALGWVNQNIEKFGGDPDNVMIFGESGGGAKTSCLYAMPGARNYFNKASIESGPGIRMLEKETASETTRMVLRHLGFRDQEWRNLLAVPVDKLVEAQVAVGRPPALPGARLGWSRGISGLLGPGAFAPIVDGRILPNHPFDPAAPAVSKDKPLIVGTNRDETTFFFWERKATDVFELTFPTLKERLQKELGMSADVILRTYQESRPDASPADIYVAITTAGMFWIGALTLAERKVAQRGAPVYSYLFVHESDYVIPGTSHKFGAGHATEIPYKFNNIDVVKALGGGGFIGANATSAATAHNMSEMWATFARIGRPAATGQPSWPAFDLKNRATMAIDARCTVVSDPLGKERELWERLKP